MSYLTIQFQYEDYNALNQECQAHIAKLKELKKEVIKDSCVLDNPEEMCINYTYEVNDFDKFWSYARHHLFDTEMTDIQEQIKRSSVIIYQMEKTLDSYIILHHFDKNTATEQIH